MVKKNHRGRRWAKTARGAARRTETNAVSRSTLPENSPRIFRNTTEGPGMRSRRLGRTTRGKPIHRLHHRLPTLKSRFPSHLDNQVRSRLRDRNQKMQADHGTGARGFADRLCEPPRTFAVIADLTIPQQRSPQTTPPLSPYKIPFPQRHKQPFCEMFINICSVEQPLLAP